MKRNYIYRIIHILRIDRNMYYIPKCMAFFSSIIILILIGSIFIVGSHNSVYGETLYVDDDGGADYTSIQDAIDNASDGDTIYVYNGTYYGNIVVDKSIDLIGENRDTTIIDGMQSDDALWIKSPSVNFSEFTVMNSSIGSWSSGIRVIEKNWWNESDPPDILSNITISDCFVKNSCCGIWTSYANKIDIVNCKISNNSWFSIYLFDSSEVLINNCGIHDNGEKINASSSYPGGIGICKDPDSWDGYNWNCGAVIISNCSISNNIYAGIWVPDRSTNVNVHHNSIYDNSRYGIEVWNGKSIVNIHDNNIFDNGGGRLWDGGIHLQDCIHTVTVKDNNIASNNLYGIYLFRSSGNTIIGNDFINNTCNAFFKLRSSFFNRWSRNYWDDWWGFGPKLVKGQIGKLLIPWFNFDWHPAKEPYDIL